MLTKSPNRTWLSLLGTTLLVSGCMSEVSPTELSQGSEGYELEKLDEYRILATGTPAGATRVAGNLTFSPDYTRTNGPSITSNLGQIPGSSSSSAPIPYLFVCAMEEDDGIDERPPAYPFASHDDGIDDVLGCGQASSTGYFDFPVLENQGAELYLVTWFCDNSDKSFKNADGSVQFHDEAEVCVRMNAKTSNSKHRKFVHSRESVLNIGERNYLNWNLSCPNIAGSTTSASNISCTSSQEEPAVTGSTNSSDNWNKEFVHAFRSAAETVKTFTSLKPTQSRVASTGCGSSGDDECAPCSDASCQDEMNIFLIDAVPSGVSGSERTCVPGTLTGNWQALYDRVCLRSGNVGAFNPFRTVHEIGHGVMRRWMNTTVNNSRGCDATDWDSGNNESSATSEAFANFFAVAAWWNSDMTGMEYDGHDAMNKGDVDLTGTCGAGNNCTCTEGKLNGEGRPTQFFVDLWQSGGETELRTQDILRVCVNFQNGVVAKCGIAVV